MEWDIKSILMVGQILITISGFIIIKFNDFKHLGKQVNSIIEKQNHHDDKFEAQSKELQSIAVKVAFLEGSVGKTYTTRRKTSRSKKATATKKTSKAKKK